LEFGCIVVGLGSWEFSSGAAFSSLPYMASDGWVIFGFFIQVVVFLQVLGPLLY